MNDVMISRKAARLNGYLNFEAMNNLIQALESARDYDSIPPIYRKWLENRKEVPLKYLSEAAKRQRRKSNV